MDFPINQYTGKSCSTRSFFLSMKYVDMVEAACEALSKRGGYVSRAQIKDFMQTHHGFVATPLAKNHLKKALAKFERKGDSYRISKEMRTAKGAKAKAGASKLRLAAKKAAAKTKLAAKKQAAKEKTAASKAKLAAKKQAAKEKAAAAKAKLAAKKQAAKLKAAAKKAASRPKKAAAKAKKSSKKAAPKKRVSKKAAKK